MEESRYSLAGMTKTPVHVVDGAKQLGRQKKLGAMEVCIHCMKVNQSTHPTTVSHFCEILNI